MRRIGTDLPLGGGQPQRIGKKRRLELNCRAGIVRQVETSGFDRCQLEIRSKNDDIIFTAREGAQGEQAVVSRMWWKLASSALRACNVGSGQAARSRDIGTRG